MTRAMPSLLLLCALTACNDDKGGDTGDTDLGDTGDTDGTGLDWDPRFDDLVEAALSDLDANVAPGVSIAVMESGEVTFAQAFGSAHPDTDQPVTADTLFQIGSTTKMLTSIALLQAVEDGAVSLDDSLSVAYPDSEFAVDADWNEQISMHHLLTHQGAFYDYFDWTAGEEDEDLVDWHAEVFFPYLWLMVAPGTFWNYSNPNFNLAGLIAEHHAGTMYPDLMTEQLFLPLGMDRTYMRKADAVADGDYALGAGLYIDGGVAVEGSVLLDDVPDVASARPAGSGTWTTPTQMMAVAKFLMEGDTAVLSDSLRGELTTPQIDLGYFDDGSTYGYGIFVSEGFYVGDSYYEVPLWDHGGNTLSYSSAFYILPDHDFAISVLSSGYGSDFSNTIATALSTLVDLGEPGTAPTTSFDPESLDGHVGTYDDMNIGEIIIDRSFDGLTIEMPYLESLGYSVADDLETVSDNVYYMKLDGVWYDLTFFAEEEGDTSRYVRNRAFVGTRVAEAQPGFAPQQPLSLAQQLELARVPNQPMLSPPPRLPAPASAR